MLTLATIRACSGLSIGTGSLTSNPTPTADVMAKRSLSALFALSPVAAGNITPSGLIAPTFTNTTDGSGTVKTYSCGQ